MKKIIIISVISILLVAGIFCYMYQPMPKIKNPYTQEYVIGESNIKGEVDIKSYSDISKDFEIGANEDGYAVFKDPKKAFDRLLKDYNLGIKLIKKQHDLGKLTYKNYNHYKKYGSYVTYNTSDNEMAQALFVYGFLDIYENSFK